MNIGYARVSTFDQNLDLQMQALRKATLTSQGEYTCNGTKVRF
jgi:DNA invertase Pin-like site-specific DNA recombinase